MSSLGGDTGSPMSQRLSAVLVGVTFGVLAWLEYRRPLRQSVECKARRNVRNLAVAGIGAAALQAAERPVVESLTRLVDRRSLGIVKAAKLPVWLEVTAAALLMDYTLYLWHVLTHRSPFLWRFHAAHHVDLDMDASTALRFHAGELLASVPWRAAQIIVIGVSPLTYSCWQTGLFMSILFHHSNARLPIGLERFLSWILVTPRMHGIHHSYVRTEMNSNWSSGLSVWDRLHGTLRLDVPQDDITIGIPAYRYPEQVTLPKVLLIPLDEQENVWELPHPAESHELTVREL